MNERADPANEQVGMTDRDVHRYLRLLHWLMASFGVLGFVSYLSQSGPLPAFAFLLGVLGSFGNLWLFNWLSRAISPAEGSRKPWQAGAFFSRYVLLITIGYVIVKALGVSPLPVIFGLFASTAAILVSGTLEIIQTLFGRERTH